MIRKPRQGLCSRYLKHLAPDTRLAVNINVATDGPPFGPLHDRRPLIAVTTGTGIAPIRSLIQGRQLLATPTSLPGPVLLFFGCRSEHVDFHFKHDWAVTPGVTVVPAFSRDPIDEEHMAMLDPYAAQPTKGNDLYVGAKEKEDYSKPRSKGGSGLPFKDRYSTGMKSFDYDRGRNYVQHHIRHQAGRVCDLVRLNPIICICGNSGRMPKSVEGALIEALVIGGIADSYDEAKKLYARLTVWQETW
jgi:sulfite reductase alpha subunit-like flavoprotein